MTGNNEADLVEGGGFVLLVIVVVRPDERLVFVLFRFGVSQTSAQKCPAMLHARD